MLSSRHRDELRDPREEILLETNFDDDGTITRSYNNSNHHNNRRRSTTTAAAYRSNISIDRFSESSLHGNNYKGGCCKSCMTRIPYATLIATVMCLIGVGIFCGTMYRGTSLTIIMLDQVFHIRLLWIEAVQTIFVIIGASMGALGLMILFIGCLATGSTRHKVYKAWRSRVGGRITCGVFMGITYILNFLWILIFSLLIITTFVYWIFWNMCSEETIKINRTCIDLTQFHFMFPSYTREEDMRVCEKHKIKAFCKDGVEKAEIMFVLATIACLLVILSFVHYLMCLAANYAHIRDHEKFQELQDLQNLNDMEYSAASKERF